jgi:flagellar hook assembly protein FlgD
LIYNIQGQLVKTLEDHIRTAGKYTAHWNGTDDSGNMVSSGVYYYKLIANDVVLTKKLAIMK